MKQDQKNICPICKSEQTVHLYNCTDFLVSKEVFDLCKCQNCTFIFTLNPPLEKEIGTYYQSTNYISHSNTTKGVVNKLYHLVRTYMLKKKGNLIEKYSHKGDILDVGAGIGLFADEMRQREWTVEGIEKSEKARKFALSEFNVALNDVSHWDNIKDKSKDVITLWHVLEHIYDLDNTWSELKRVLKDDGCLIIALPNSSSYDAKHYKKDWAAFDVPRHLWHYNPNSFKINAENQGFAVIDKIKMNFDGFYISMLSEQNKGSKLSFIKGVFFGFIGWIRALINRSNSSSIIYVLKKNSVEL